MNRVIQKAIHPLLSTKIFKRTLDSEAADFWILLDLSYSMSRENKLTNAKKALATVYDSIKSTKSPINIRMFGFSTLKRRDSSEKNHVPL